MKVLVACEESQAVTIELRKLGHEAYSCDLQSCSGGFPEWHIQDDVLKLLHLNWDMIIAHPPCTYLSNAGSNSLVVNGKVQEDRMKKAIEAKSFFMNFYNADCSKIAIENPIPGRIHSLPQYNQIIQPYMFGDPWLKATCLWLRGLPCLFATDICIPEGKWVSSSDHRRPGSPCSYSMMGQRSAKMRSKTFPGIARAMAEQWAGDIYEHMAIYRYAGQR